jgi:pilus assembly protein CpaB
MNWKNLVSLLVAIVMGLAALWIGRNIILGKQVITTKADGDFVAVVVANKDLDPGHLITAEDISTMKWPADAVTKTVFTDNKAVVGRAVLTPIVKGQTMFEGLLAAAGSEGGLTALVPDGMRAVAIEITESSGVGWMLVPGCRVDVIAALRQGENNSEMARTIVENVKVTAVGQRLAKDRSDGSRSSGEVMKTVTLIVTPKDAESIELANNTGKLRLVLRGANDTKPTDSPGVRMAELTGGPPDNAGPTTKPASGFLSMLAALASMPTTQPTTPAEQEVYVRRAERIIRGGSEGTVYYQRRANDAADGWNVTSVVEEKSEPKGLFK